MWAYAYAWQACLAHAEVGDHDELFLYNTLVGSGTMSARGTLPLAEGRLGEEISDGRISEHIAARWLFQHDIAS